MDEDAFAVPPRRTDSGGCEMLLDLAAVLVPGIDIMVPARLRYDPAAPWAVHLDNHINHTDPVTWIFARDLLIKGVDQQTGAADVVVHPDPHGEHTYLVLSAPGGSALLRARTQRIRTFTACTTRIVPPGTEDRHLDLDRLLRDILASDSPPGPQ
ncbi:SsgA family sporulation/cell division regulator [Streptomyces sp. NPDC059247]|uniref:SsgA family sporulation/cell division regulator n=1 Tax=Streptomyces sp. NPDC059247 TaxID=3346790 RepID=UPI003682CF6B